MGKMFVVIACLTTIAEGGPLTYDVSRIIAGPVTNNQSMPFPQPVFPARTADYRVIGTITTDGTLGLLSAVNIIDWVLRYGDGSGSWTESLGGGFQFAAVSTVIASNTELTFDPALSPTITSLNPGIGFGPRGRNPRWSLFGPYETLDSGFGREGPLVTHSAPYAFATINAGVPEPGPLSLLGAGLLAGLVVRGGIARRRQSFGSAPRDVRRGHGCSRKGGNPAASGADKKTVQRHWAPAFAGTTG